MTRRRPHLPYLISYLGQMPLFRVPSSLETSPQIAFTMVCCKQPSTCQSPPLRLICVKLRPSLSCSLGIPRTSSKGLAYKRHVYGSAERRCTSRCRTENSALGVTQTDPVPVLFTSWLTISLKLHMLPCLVERIMPVLCRL